VAALNDDFVQQIDLNASRDGLAKEDPRGRYANLIAVHAGPGQAVRDASASTLAVHQTRKRRKNCPHPDAQKPRAQRIWLRQSASAAPWGEARSA
jgi:hypothetical protein